MRERLSQVEVRELWRSLTASEHDDACDDNCVACHYRRRGRLWLNAYTVDRCFGGPEEGGWWYDQWVPLAGLQVSTEEYAVAAYDLLCDTYEDREGRWDRFQSVGGPDVVLLFEPHEGQPDPPCRPVYE